MAFSSANLFMIFFLFCSNYTWPTCLQLLSWSPFLQWFRGGSDSIQKDCPAFKIIRSASLSFFVVCWNKKLCIEYTFFFSWQRKTPEVYFNDSSFSHLPFLFPYFSFQFPLHILLHSMCIRTIKCSRKWNDVLSIRTFPPFICFWKGLFGS